MKLAGIRYARETTANRPQGLDGTGEGRTRSEIPRFGSRFPLLQHGSDLPVERPCQTWLTWSGLANDDPLGFHLDNCLPRNAPALLRRSAQAAQQCPAAEQELVEDDAPVALPVGADLENVAERAAGKIGDPPADQLAERPGLLL
jgi:hypothetical protein